MTHIGSQFKQVQLSPDEDSNDLFFQCNDGTYVNGSESFSPYFSMHCLSQKGALSFDMAECVTLPEKSTTTMVKTQPPGNWELILFFTLYIFWSACYTMFRFRFIFTITFMFWSEWFSLLEGIVKEPGKQCLTAQKRLLKDRQSKILLITMTSLLLLDDT